MSRKVSNGNIDLIMGLTPVLATEQSERLFSLPTAAGEYTHMFPVPPPQPSDSGIGSEKPDESDDDEIPDIEGQPDGFPWAGEFRHEVQKGDHDKIGKVRSDFDESWVVAGQTIASENGEGPVDRLRRGSRKKPLSSEQSLQAAPMRDVRACLKCHIMRSKVRLMTAANT
jgi:hypothetical protein